jgi:hypothetical protein
MAGMMGRMDTAQTAKQPQVSGADEEKVFTMMVAGLREHVFGKGEQGIVKRMSEAEAEDVGRVCGEMVFSLVREAAKQAESAGHELSIDMLLGVATELIDDISELMEAYGKPMDEKQREFALLYAQQLYVENSNPTDEEREAAKQSLSAMRESGDVATATEYVQQRGAEAGADPFGVAEMKPKPGMMAKE